MGGEPLGSLGVGSGCLGVGRFFPLAHPPLDMSEFTVSGRYQARDGWQAFETTIEAPNEDVARERVYANLGSQHNLKRTRIDIEGVGA